MKIGIAATEAPVQQANDPAPAPVRARKAAPAKVTPTEQPDRVKRIEAFCTQLNKDMQGNGYIGMGSRVKWLDPERIRTGILGLDVISAGGIPRRSMTHLWGPYSVSKTTTLFAIIAASQRRGNNSLYAPSETFSKSWARDCGCWIQHSADEYQSLEDKYKGRGLGADYHAVRASLELYDKGAPGLGQFCLVMHAHGDGLLEAATLGVETNSFDGVYVDSLAACKPGKWIDETEIGDDEHGSGRQIQMLIQFTHKVNSAFSARYDDAGNRLEKAGEASAFNETAVVVTNQALVDQDARSGPLRGPSGPKMKPSMGSKIHHAWNLSIEFKRGYLEDGVEEVTIDGDNRKQAAGIEVAAYVNKSKVGPPYRTAQWHLYTREFDRFKPGEVDAVREARVWGTFYDVIRQDGAWYTLPGERRVNGKDKVNAILLADPAMRAAIEDAVIERCKQ